MIDMRKLILIIMAAFCLMPSTPAQTNKQKKLAVVLSGGGAKGMAHIGVLKVLERAGIPIDIVTGTSMGSIVGGLYATGISASTLDSLVRAQDWSFVLSDKEDLSHQTLKEREKQNTYLLSKSINFKGRKLDDGGLIAGKNLDVLFTSLIGEYNDSLDFNSLPIPYACVATNIIDNTEYVFHSGLLRRAMRASMAIPGAFAPVRYGDMVLVDGGLRNNFPVDIAREMGADYVIGVTVQGAPKTAKDLHSTTSILSQIVDVNCKNKYEANLQLTDIPIRVDTHGYGSASFTPAAIDTLIRRGEEEAMKHWDEIIALRDSLGINLRDSLDINLSAPRAYRPRMPLPNNHQHKVGRFVFVDMTENDVQFIRNKFGLKEGKSIDDNRADLITTSIRRDLFYKQASFHFDKNTSLDTNEETAVFIAGVKRANEINVGIRFDTEEKVSLIMNADFPLRTEMPVDLDMTVRLGKRNMGRADLTFHPKSRFRHTLSYAFQRNDIDIFSKGEKSYNLTYSQHTASFTLLNFDIRNFNFVIGPQWDYYKYSSLLIDQTKDMEFEPMRHDNFISYQAQVNYNSENHWTFPTRGARFFAKFAYYTDNFVDLDDKIGPRELTAMWRMSFKINSFLSVQPLLYGRIMDAKAVPYILHNTVGGDWFGHYIIHQMPFPGVKHVEITGNKFIAAQGQIQANVTQNNIIQLRFAAAQQADEFKELMKSRTMLGATLGYHYNTMFGPVGATLGYSNKSKILYGFLNLGFVF